MDSQQILISLILCVTMVMFGWGRWRYDLVAMAALLLCVVTGLVAGDAAFVGFGHPAVITVAAVLILSTALKNAGVVDEVASRIEHLTETPIMHIASLTLVVTVASAFMNNVGALALMLPIALSTARERGRSPALILMPMAFGSLLGGMTTLIGTPPNIIVSGLRADYTDAGPFGMFDYSPVGLPITLVGLVFIIFIGWRLIPKARLEHNATEELFEISHYLTEASVTDTSPAIGNTLASLLDDDSANVEIIGIAGRQKFVRTGHPGYKISQGDILVIRADPTDLQPFLERHKLELQSSASPAFVEPDPQNEIMIEGVVRDSSELVGRGVDFLRRKTGRTVALVGMARHGQRMTKRLRQAVFRKGDVLLLRADADLIDEQFSVMGLFPLAHRKLELNRTRRVFTAIAVFAVAVALGIAKVVTMPVAFMLAIMAFLLLGILNVRQIYDDIDWPIIVLLAAMIPVGNALKTTGTTDLVATTLVQVTQGLPIPLILTLVLVVTMLLSDVINNAATALVMGPLGISMAGQLQVNPDPFLMSVAVGASCAFLTPIGHQCNTLVMGPGGYKFTDYWRVGLPLEIVITVVSIPVILWFWPL